MLQGGLLAQYFAFERFAAGSVQDGLTLFRVQAARLVANESAKEVDT